MTKTSFLIAAIALAAAGTSQAAIEHSQDIVGNVIFGSGNADGGWTTFTQGNLQLALRGKVRYGIPGDAPANVFNDNGDGTFSHAAGAPAALPNRARWNFEWSVNTDADGSGGSRLSDYDFVLGVDSDAGFGTTWHSYSLTGASGFTAGAPYTHSFGNNGTAESGGDEATDLTSFLSLVSASSLMQNSTNMDFVDDGVLFATDFNPNLDGNYSFFLEARDRTSGAVLGRTDITVIVGAGAAAPVSAPGSLALVALGLLSAAALRRRKR